MPETAGCGGSVGLHAEAARQDFVGAPGKVEKRGIFTRLNPTGGEGDAAFQHQGAAAGGVGNLDAALAVFDALRCKRGLYARALG